MSIGNTIPSAQITEPNAINNGDDKSALETKLHLDVISAMEGEQTFDRLMASQEFNIASAEGNGSYRYIKEGRTPKATRYLDVGECIQYSVSDVAEVVIEPDGMISDGRYLPRQRAVLASYDAFRGVAQKLGIALAKARDDIAAATFVAGARAENVVNGLPGGSTITITETTGQTLYAAIVEAREILDTKELIGVRAFAILQTTDFYKLRQVPELKNADFVRNPSVVTENIIPTIANVEVIQTNTNFAQNFTGLGNTGQYDIDARQVKCIVTTNTACSKASWIDPDFIMEFKSDYRGYFASSTEMQGYGVINPDQIVEVVDSSVSLS